MQVDAITRDQAQAAPALALQTATASKPNNFRDMLQRPDPLLVAHSHSNSLTPVHTVKAGETLSDICRKALQDAKKDSSDAATWVAVQKVAKENNLKNPDLITPGQVLSIGALQTVKSPIIGLTAASKAVPATGSTQPTTAPVAVRMATLPPPVAPSVAQAVATASPNTSRPRTLAFRDSSLSSSYLNDEAKTAKTTPRADLGDLIQRILNPSSTKAVAKAAVSETTALPATAAATAALATPTTADTTPLTGPWAKLLNSPAHLTSEFGVRKDPFNGHMSLHPGIDLAADKGSKIFPIEPGTVTYSGWMEGYGKVVMVKHQDGLESVYGHNSTNLAKVGDTVSTNTPIGLVGSTGRSTGAHLHFEIRKKGVAVDPIPVMKNELLQVAKTF